MFKQRPGTAGCVIKAASLPGESSSYKKTPKRLSRSKRKSPALNSPSNDVDQQNEIFWDPHSPTTFKIENGRRKRQTANKCTVEISDIVNRIAPKNEKPADATYLQMWIGDDAIPSTPVVARSRTKVSLRPRSFHTEELLKLAREFDRNLVEAIQSQEQHHLTSADDKTVRLGAAQIYETDTFLEDITEEDVELALKSVSQSSRVSTSSHGQKSVDQEAEAALNALFDCSTQKVSGRLSQTLSDISLGSTYGLPVGVKDNTGEISLHATVDSDKDQTHTVSKQIISLNESHSKLIHTSKRIGSVMAKEKSRQTESNGVSDPAASKSDSRDCFEDDWDHDFFDDDSFIMEITQNPNLIATPKSEQTNSKSDKSGFHSVGSKTSENFKDNDKNVVSKKSNTYVSRTSNVQVDSHSVDKSDINILVPSTSYVSQLPLNSQTIHSMQSNHSLVRDSDSFTRGLSKNLSTNSEMLALHNVPMKPSPCHVPRKQNHAPIPEKASVQLDEWDDPKFSDDVLDMFCESDSLLEANEEDDDLLYQVCDDVERLTQAKITNEAVNKTENRDVIRLSCAKTVTRITKAAQASQHFGQNKNGSQIFQSFSRNTFSENATQYNSSTNCSLQKIAAPSAVTGLGTCGSATTNENGGLSKTNLGPVKFDSFTSIPSASECTKILPIGTQPQSMGNPQVSTTTAKSLMAPSKFTFTRTKSSQIVPSHTYTGGTSDFKKMNSQDMVGNKNHKNPLVPKNELLNHPFSLKRQLSESVLQSTKVLISEERNTKCSMEEIERKKQKALARKQMRGHALSSDTAHP
ncbi:ewing's tumor-associated antigen 1 isoform X2 [Xenopus laevis]|uniref:Ewing's tumor-associated antigen 1 isoform X2 n=2 Tax=Xenopus laevis TaxID=8355 RepID=A0A8J0VB63_XENLA|nr:ewing's tumor-associated antigen 1 isoform X2 [Xenopus laevis]